MTTIREQIVAAVIDLLNDARDSDIPLATGRRWLAGDSTDLPTISVWRDVETRERERGSARFGGPAVRNLSLNIQVITSASDQSLAEAAADEYLEWIDDQLSDTTLDDLAHRFEVERVTWEAIQSDRLYVVVTVQCLIQYQTTRGDSSLHQ